MANLIATDPILILIIQLLIGVVVGGQLFILRGIRNELNTISSYLVDHNTRISRIEGRIND